MDFDNSFSIQAPVAQVWSFMMQVDEVAPCVPGAQITETVDDTHFKGTVKVKLGAVSMTFKGELEMLPDESARTISLKARGQEARGGSGASALITTVLTEADGGTRVAIHSHVDVTGKLAQFGRSIIPDVAGRLIKEFAACLQTKLTDRIPPEHEDVAEERRSGVHDRAAEAGAADTDRAGEEDVRQTLTTPPGRAVQEGSSPQVLRAPVAPTAGDHLSVTGLIAGIVRSRAASVLRSLAARIDPE